MSLAPAPASRGSYLLAAVASYLIWGMLVFPIRWLQGWAPGTILLFRVGLAVSMLWLFLATAGRSHLRAGLAELRSASPAVRRFVWGRIVLGGMLLAVNWGVYIYVVNQVNMRTASFAYLICPILTALLGFVWLRERLGLWQWLAVLLAAGSCLVLGRENVSEVGYSLFVATTYAVYLVSQRRVVLNRLVLAAGHFTVSLLVLLPMAPWLMPAGLPHAVSFYGKVALMSAVFTILPSVLNLYALQGISSGSLGMLGYLNPILVFLIAYFIFAERATAVQWAGYAVLLGAVGLFNLHRFKRFVPRHLGQSAN